MVTPTYLRHIWLALSAWALAGCAAAPLESLPVQEGPGVVTFEISAQPVFIEPDVRDLPGFIHRILPKYPQRAIDTGTEGEVEVHVLITADGWPSEVQLVKSFPVFDQEVVTAARTSSYRPGRNLEGEPIAAWVSITARFELR